MFKNAILSDDRKFRYKLWRIWDDEKPYVMFIGLNPSTADEKDDDPTIRRCIGFAKSWGFGGICMVNLFSLRATDPRELLTTLYCGEGDENKRHILDAAKLCTLHVAAWGNGDIVNEKEAVLPDYIGCEMAIRKMPLFALTTNKDGQPGHPLYIKADTTPVLWNWDILEKYYGRKY